MTNRKPNRAALWIGNVLLVAGAVAVGIWACSWLSLNIWQMWQSHEFDRNRAATSQAPAPQRQMHVASGSIVGRLDIKRLHVKAMVREGDSDHTLSVALGHIPGTAFPGQSGNVGIAGHRDSLFRGLKNITPNDEITFETPHANYIYRVESTEIVKPRQVDVLNPGPTRELTLVTCFPFNYVGSAPDRFIVKARLVSEDDSAQNRIRDENIVDAPRAVVRHAPVSHDIAFTVAEGHSRELVPGKIWLGLSSADSELNSVSGWLWVMPDRRTIWLRDVDTHHPVVFYQDGEKREVVLTKVARASATGYLLPSPPRG
ncbi:MAG TPA: class D sortase [Bryobacteraceae bacterium]|jgi:sortase A|nr:class D sortase [Bryobacteraceae bacterium]